MLWIVPPLVVAAAAVALAFVPLFQVLGFEFAVAMGVVIAYVSGWMAVMHAERTVDAAAPADDGAAFPGRAVALSLAANLALLPLPVAVALLNTFRTAACDFTEGLSFYAIICIPAVFYGTALGFLLGLRFTRRRALVAFLLWSLCSMSWTLWNVVREPPIFAFNAFLAFFPGPVYDRVVPLDGRLIVARALVMLEAMVFWAAAVVFWDGRRLRGRLVTGAFSGWRAVPAIIGSSALLAFLLAQGHADVLGLRITREFIQAQLGGRIETTHCIIYYAESAYTPERARELAGEHEFHYDELRQWFETEPHRKLRSYVYASASQKKRLMGAAGTNFEDALNDEIHLNAELFPHPILRHEMAHIFAAQIDRWWPVCPLMGIHEGLAVAADWRQSAGGHELTADEACVAMQTLGVLPDLQRTLSAFGFWTQASARAYTVCGSFLHDLVEEHGMQAMKELWSSRDFESTYGQPLAQLIGSWQQRRLDPIHLTPRQLRLASQIYLRRSVFQEPCAHEQARLRSDAASALAIDPQQADSLYARLVAIEPQRPDARLGQLRARLRQRDWQGSLQLVDDLWQSPTLTASDSTSLAQWHGDALWLRGDHAAAESLYAQALKGAAARSTRRALQVNLAVLQQTELRELLRDYLIESNQDDTTSLTLLATAASRQPQSVWPRYLLGRRLYYAHRFEEAIAALQHVERHPLPDDIRLATLELLAWSFLRSGQAAAARDLTAAALGRTGSSPAAALATLPWSAAERLRLEDLQRRAEALLH